MIMGRPSHLSQPAVHGKQKEPAAGGLGEESCQMLVTGMDYLG